MAVRANSTPAPAIRRRPSATGADLFPQTGENPLSPTEAGIPALPVRRLRTAFYAAGHLLPIDFADRVALLERRERILDLAEALLDLADAMDAPLEDREPEPVEAADDEATLQPVTLAPDWLRTKNGRRAVKVRHCAAPFQAFRAPGEPLPQKGERA